MGFEIERKFLLASDDWQGLVTDRTSIRQAYLSSESKASIRVRIKDDASATLTFKSRPTELRRLELEYAIPVLEAEALIGLRQGAVIEKVRHEVPWGDLVWEIDVFSGDNDGLVIAEIELRHEHQQLNCRAGSVRRSPACRSTTTARWCVIPIVRGLCWRRTMSNAGGAERRRY